MSAPQSLFDVLPRTGLTVEDARSKLDGYHFAQEAFDASTREVLYIAEGLLRLVDSYANRYAGPKNYNNGEPIPCGWANGYQDCQVPDCSFPSERCLDVQRERMAK